MNFYRHILTLALLLAASFAFAQVPIRGELRLGDTSQVHILTTKDGNRLFGRVTGFDQEELSFLFKNQNTLVFKISEIESIEVQGETAPETALPKRPQTSKNPFTYNVWDNGEVVATGQLLRGTGFGFRLEDKDGRSEFFQWLRADSLTLAGPAISDAGEPPAELHSLTTPRGDRFAGQVLNFNGSTLRFLLPNGAILKFSVKDIKSLNLEKTADAKPAELPQDVQMQGHEKLYFSPSAFLLKRKQGEFRTVIFNNSVEYGVSDNFTIGGGFATVIVASILNAKAKFGGSLGEHLHVAGGVQFYGATAIESGVAGAALAYGALTVGSPERFLSVAIGRGTSSEADGGTTGFTLSGSFRTGRNWRLFGEYLNFTDSFGDSYGFAIAGASWFNNNHRIDFGMSLIPIDDFDSQTFLPIPIVSYAYRF